MKTYIALAAGGIALAVAFGAWLYARQSPAVQELPANGQSAPQSGLQVGETLEQNGDIIERLPDAENEEPVAPPLDRPVTRPATMDEAVFTQVQSNITQTVAVLKEGDNFNAWMNLATLRTILEDYEGSKEILIYISKRYAPSWQVFANLGALYSTYLNSPGDAIAQYKRAIELLPSNPSLYRSLFEVQVRKGDLKQGVDTLKEGIARAPDAIDLYVLLARHLRSVGSEEEARSYYTLAAEQADKANNLSLKSDIESERNTP